MNLFLVVMSVTTVVAKFPVVARLGAYTFSCSCSVGWGTPSYNHMR